MGIRPDGGDVAELFIDYHGAGLRIAAPGETWLNHLRSASHAFLVPEPASNAFSAEINLEDAPSAPAGIPHTWTGELIERCTGHLFETDTRWVLDVPQHGYIDIDRAGGSALAVFRPGSEEAFNNTPLMSIMDAALAGGGQQMVHAACLVTPRRDGAILICAPSGFGKTTTTLALAHEGFGLVSDDLSIVCPGEGVRRVWGMPRNLKVHRKTARMLPWIGPLHDSWDAEDEQEVDPDDLADRIEVATPEPRDLLAIIVIGQRRSDGHSLARVAKADALVRIAQDNVSNSATGVKPWNNRQFAVFADMVRSVPLLELNAAPRLAGIGTCVEEALAQVRAPVAGA